jgi:hypothetical protein
MKAMHYYTIAGHILEVRGEGLGRVPGFSPFLSAFPGKKPFLSFCMEQKMQDWEAASLYTFNVEGSFCGEWFAGAGGRYFLRLVTVDGKNYRLEIRPEGNEFSAFTDMDGTTSPRLLRLAVGTAFNVAALSRQTVSIHASTINCGGKAVSFLGESGTGKSTHSALWLRHIPGVELLNDDAPYIRCDGGGAIVYGSPWSGKTPCYKNESATAVAFVRLRQAPHNEIKRLSGLSAIGALLPSIPSASNYGKQLSDSAHALLSEILRTVPVYLLDCLPDAAAARLVFDTLKKDGCL